MATNTANHAHDEHPEMDYPQHNATYAGFIAMMKYGIITMVLVVVALYCFIVGHQPVLGALLLLLIPVGAVVLLVTKSRSAA